MIRLLLALLQGATATVGDTVYLEHALGDVGSAVVRPQPWVLGELGQQLGPAEVRLGERGAVVRYALVFWYAGTHSVTMPGAVLVRRDGSSDTLATTKLEVEVASVLPTAVRRSSLAPKGASVPIPLEARSPILLLLLLGLVLIVFGTIAVLWRRKGKAPPPPATAVSAITPALLARWAESGEYRAVLGAWLPLLARRLELSRDLTESGELQKLLDDISFTVFTPEGPAEFASLCERAARLGGA